MMRYDTKCRVVINPGTVGQTFSFWDKFRTDNRSQYAILEIDGASRFDVHFRKVIYDRLSEIELAERKKLPYFELYKELIETGKMHTHDLELLTSINEKYNYETDIKGFLAQLDL